MTLNFLSIPQSKHSNVTFQTNETIDPFLRLIHLFKYSDTKCELLGSRQRFGVKTRFSDKDVILIENVCIQRLWNEKLNKEFPNKDWRQRGLIKL